MKTNMQTNGWLKIFLESDEDAASFIRALRKEGVESVTEQEGGGGNSGMSGGSAGTVKSSDFSIYNSKDTIVNRKKKKKDEEDEGEGEGEGDQEELEEKDLISDDQTDKLDDEAGVGEEDLEESEMEEWSLDEAEAATWDEDNYDDDDDEKKDKPTDAQLDDRNNKEQLFDDTDEMHESLDPISLLDRIIENDRRRQ